MTSIIFVTAAGVSQTVITTTADSVMKAAVQNDIEDILGECGGAATCGTCHVYVDAKWLDRLPPMSDDENEILDMVIGRRSNSRLSCQIKLEEALDGLVVEMPAHQGLS